MAPLDVITIVACVVGGHAMLRLWRNRETPGALPCLLLFAAIGLYLCGALLPTPSVYLLYATCGVLAGCLFFYRSTMFDLRPIARSLLIDSVRDGMMVVDQQRRVIDCNHAAAGLIGEDRRALAGRPAVDLLPREFAAMLQSTVHLRAELAVETGDGRAWFEVDVTPLEVGGRPAGHLIIARDITERRQVQDALEQSRRDLEAANARLIEQSVTDPLTGLKNRRFLFQRLNEEINRHQRSGSTLGLLVVDLDHFKAVNDTHGHPTGDDALVQVATTLVGSVRDCDVVARLGGEEFAVLAVNTEPAGLVKLADRIRRAIAHTPVARQTDRPMILTASIGVALASSEHSTADALFATADRYLYAAKHQGRNRVVAAPHPASANPQDGSDVGSADATSASTWVRMTSRKRAP